MNPQPLEGIKACVFDAYGTLFDYASAAAQCRGELGDKLDAINALWREKQLQYSWLRTLEGKYADFWTVTGDALDFTLDAIGVASPALRERLMQLYLTLNPFPEVPEMLRRLKQGGSKPPSCRMARRPCCSGRSRVRSSGHCLTRCCRLRRLACTSRIRRSINSRSIGWASPARRSHFNRLMPGTLTQPPPSACASFGAIAMTTSRNACREGLTGLCNP